MAGGDDTGAAGDDADGEARADGAAEEGAAEDGAAEDGAGRGGAADGGATEGGTDHEGARDRRHRVASTADLPTDGSRVIAEVAGQEVAVFRIDGAYHALPNFCPHQGAPLCEGELTGRMVVGADGWTWEYVQDDEIVTCPWHGWKFDVTTGRNVKDREIAVPSYDVEVEDGEVYVVR